MTFGSFPRAEATVTHILKKKICKALFDINRQHQTNEKGKKNSVLEPFDATMQNRTEVQ